MRHDSRWITLVPISAIYLPAPVSLIPRIGEPVPALRLRRVRFPFARRLEQGEVHRPVLTLGLHSHRTAGGHRDYRRVGRPAPPRCSGGPRSRASRPVRQQLEAAWPGDVQLHLDSTTRSSWPDLRRRGPGKPRRTFLGVCWGREHDLVHVDVDPDRTRQPGQLL